MIAKSRLLFVFSLFKITLLSILLYSCTSSERGLTDCGDTVDSNCDTSAKKGELPYVLYVRGGFNGWGAENAFVATKPPVYEAVLRIAPGNHEFKLAPNDWREEWVIKGAGRTPVALNTKHSLQKGGGGNYLFVRRTGYYKFRVDFSRGDAPSLEISETEGPSVTTVNPHKKHKKTVTESYPTYPGDKGGEAESVLFSVLDPSHKYRRYAQTTSQALRDPDPQYIRYEEKQGYPRVRSGSLSFDALFAMSLKEMREDSVSDIKDGNYNNGESIPCDCFETGAKWHYVWTRDLSYAADLSLAMLDPERVKNSLNFKLAEYREGITKPGVVNGSEEGLQIVQDTGTGGSWPISTDRVTWAFGAEKVLHNLQGEARMTFAKRAYQGLKNTVEIDRQAAFDGHDGLYVGEQSFLDWRDQTYASWIVRDIASLGTAKSLSTNVGHFQALKLASQLAQEMGDVVSSIKYRDWANDLREAINRRFWLEEEGLYSSLTASHFDGAALKKYDWLGISLAVLTGVADSERARASLSNYPHGPMGAPVIFPQQPNIPVYHNRGIWPFVTAYGLRAATAVGNSVVATDGYRTLIRGAAVNLSNMENLEWLSAQPLLLDEKLPQMSGPVINSKRQLWSVAGYLGMVVESLFGVSSTESGIAISPFLTVDMRNREFANSTSLSLLDLQLRNKTLNIKLILPPASQDKDGHYRVASTMLNGRSVEGNIPWSALQDSNSIKITLGAVRRDGQTLTRVAGDPYSSDDPNLFAPLEPALGKAVANAAGLRFPIAHPGESASSNDSSIGYTLFRDGEVVSSARTDTGKGGIAIVDPETTTLSSPHCYALEAHYTSSGTTSHHSEARCIGISEFVAVTDPRITSNLKPVTREALSGPFLEGFGAEGDTFEVAGIHIREEGVHGFQLKYHNAHNQINLGITNGVKWLTIKDEKGNDVASGVIQMPHAQVVSGKKPWVYSSPLMATLPEGVYALVIEDFMNMSYLAANTTFTGSGGVSGKLNTFDVAGLRVQRVFSR